MQYNKTAGAWCFIKLIALENRNQSIAIGEQLTSDIRDNNNPKDL